jgi:uridine kinase
MPYAVAVLKIIMEASTMNSKIKMQLINGECREYERNTTLLEMSKDVKACYSTPVIAAKVNNVIKDLQSVIVEDGTVEFFDLKSDIGNKVYQRSLTFLMITAARELFSQGEVTVEHSLSKGLYCELHLGRDLKTEDLDALSKRMRAIVEENRPIVMKSLPIAEAIQLFTVSGQLVKVKHLQQLNRPRVRVYYCGTAYDYFYGTMAPYTGYLKVFEIRPYAAGFILRFPTPEQPETLPDFVEQRKLSDIFLEAEQWGSILRCGYVSTLNEYVEQNAVADIIRVAEALHEKKIAQIADFVAEHKDKVRLILVAGPSSSGKTTFAQRLNIQLRVNNVRPVPISLDDYFVNREDTPKDENGKFDFEAIEAIDLPLFNEHLCRILNGEAVELPFYNFMKGKREYRGHVIQVDADQPLIIEGIHGLNERLTSSVDREQKIKIYISALTQLSIDKHNRIPTTDTRLIRRIVRDSQFRSHDALRTLKMWPSVRQGEEKNIFPFQEEADMMFNSALIYELGVLKKYAEPLLAKVTPLDEEYPEAVRLLNFLAYFKSIDDLEVAPNSILREFIGNSCFYR